MSARLAAVCLGPGGIPKARVDSASVHELGLDFFADLDYRPDIFDPASS